MEKKKDNFVDLNNALIEHYHCFNTERFFLDAFTVEDKFVCVASSSIGDCCPVKLCRGIARFIKKHSIANSFPFIYVAAYNFKTEAL